MSIWGKILGGAAGLLTGGPIGILLGTLAGHAVDRKRDGEEASADADGDATQSIAFTIGVIVLAAKMAKSDGTVKRVEVDTFMRLFHAEPEELGNVGYVFDLARRDAAGFEPYARQIAGLFGPAHPVLEDLLESLILIAEADDVMHDAELDYLHTLATIFGFSEADFARLVSGHRITHGDSSCDPYTVLGLPCGAEEEAVRAAYRRLAREHHPDRLIAQGLPPEFIEVATDRMAAINAAYDRIMKQGARV
ncbi:DnaJ domain-containing protein [Azospirillum sp. RWY-5-1]|uniref:DnaJ domain-containing protein n=1 Tax=Azospirillum oleiclasticum TaxID=2735135 RepID=A0ABX2T5B6_9PROT|nr:TerB family tellurite resistance protein [Azospirillum oleiclasticum]NYZ11870.1 DnaJ domain-containing protein [Azospirillum oleiclasticum]NYZ19030.1 DnaJ domain-containing protein [Azospirillum oleiclasticum]